MSFLQQSEPTKYTSETLKSEEMLFNLGPQHPSMHGVLRLEVITDGEMVREVVPHIGYLHRCFEKHAESLNYAQIIPYIDRMDYVASMNSEHIYALGVEQLLGMTDKIPKRCLSSSCSRSYQTTANTRCRGTHETSKSQPYSQQYG